MYWDRGSLRRGLIDRHRIVGIIARLPPTFSNEHSGNPSPDVRSLHTYLQDTRILSHNLLQNRPQILLKPSEVPDIPVRSLALHPLKLSFPFLQLDGDVRGAEIRRGEPGLAEARRLSLVVVQRLLGLDLEARSVLLVSVEHLMDIPDGGAEGRGVVAGGEVAEGARGGAEAVFARGGGIWIGQWGFGMGSGYM